MGLILISSQPVLAWVGKCKSLFDNIFLFHRNPYLFDKWDINVQIEDSSWNHN